MFSNWHCIFDSNRTGSISLLEFKQLMLILCNTQNFEHFVTEEFSIACDHNRCVNRFRFESILKVISKLFSYLEENVYYRSQAIGDIVHECFEQVNFPLFLGQCGHVEGNGVTCHFSRFRSQCPGMIGLNEYQFACLWQNQAIQFAQYANVVALIHRIKESQNVVHEAQCVNCRQSPIVGIRFKCQQCRGISLCFECFCTGYKTAKHEITHRMYEISKNVSDTPTSGLANLLCITEHLCHRFVKSCPKTYTSPYASWQQIKRNVVVSALSSLFKCRSTSSQAPDKKPNKTLTMETRFTDDQSMTTATTIIECINDTGFSSIRETRQLKDQTSNFCH